VGFAGLVNYDSGVIRSSIMLPDWVEVPLQSIIEKHFGNSVRIDNDANAAAYGEWWVGAGKGSRTVVCLTIGTGIGGGLIINNELYRGPDGTAAEFGNMTIDYDGPLCWCGNRGCLNPLASGTAITRRTVKKIKQGKRSKILDFVNSNLDEITPPIIAKAAFEGDELACQIIAETAMLLGAGIANLVNALNPDVVVLSGGVAEIGELLINRIRAEVQKRAFEIPVKRAKILKATLGYKAGAVGAAGMLIHALL
jgi:glucokinase